MNKYCWCLGFLVYQACVAEGKPDASDEVDLSIIKLENDTNGKDNLHATFDVKYAGITKKLAPGKSIEIYHVGS